MIELRPYQHEAIEGLRDQIRQGMRSVVLVLPCGGGKTVIAASVMLGALQKGSHLLFIAHRRELITQCYQKMLDIGVPEDQLGVLMADGKIRLRDGRVIKAARHGAPIQIASIDTLRHRTKPKANIVFADECHRSLSKSFLDVRAAYPDAVHIGLTATPYRGDGKGLGGYYDTLVVGATPSLLIQLGFLVKPRIWTVPPQELPDLSNVRTRAGDYDEKELGEACDNKRLVGSIVEHWKKHADGRRTVCFPVNIAHSKHIVEDFRLAGVPAEHLDGDMPTDLRDAILSRLDRGETLVVSSCGVLCEGFDMPSVKCAILARPTKSTGLYLQCAGRVLRPWNNVGAVILDHAGCVLLHGAPSEDREFTLDDSKPPTPKLSSKCCTKCFAIVETSFRHCPACGESFPEPAVRSETEAEKLEHVEGDLVEHASESSEERAVWDALCRTVEQRNYKPGYAGWKFKEQFGHWPPRSWPKPRGRSLTDQEKIEMRARLTQVAQSRNIPLSWVDKKMEEQR